MSTQAQITSVEALEAFRSDLVVYLGQMQPVLDEIGSDVVRMKFWLQNEQHQHWEGHLRQRRRKLEEAQAELFNARLSTFQDSTMLQQMAVQKAQRAVQEAEEKMAALKRWERELETQSNPLVKQVDQLKGFVATDLAEAVTYLTQVIKALEAYKEVVPTSSSAPSTPPSADNQTVL
jgi:chromosome segregation ATPase